MEKQTPHWVQSTSGAPSQDPEFPTWAQIKSPSTDWAPQAPQDCTSSYLPALCITEILWNHAHQLTLSSTKHQAVSNSVQSPQALEKRQGKAVLKRAWRYLGGTPFKTTALAVLISTSDQPLPCTLPLRLHSKVCDLTSMGLPWGTAVSPLPGPHRCHCLGPDALCGEEAGSTWGHQAFGPKTVSCDAVKLRGQQTEGDGRGWVLGECLLSLPFLAAGPLRKLCTRFKINCDRLNPIHRDWGGGEKAVSSRWTCKLTFNSHCVCTLHLHDSPLDAQATASSVAALYNEGRSGLLLAALYNEGRSGLILLLGTHEEQHWRKSHLSKPPSSSAWSISHIFRGLRDVFGHRS